jgi:ribokinase
LLEVVDVLIVNEDELTRISRERGSVAQMLSAVKVPCAIVTLGSRGCCAWTRGTWAPGQNEEGKRAHGEFLLQPAFKIEPVDTTAAGDTFCGVLVAALNSNATLSEAVRRASAGAALATTRIGAQASIPTYDEVEGLLRIDAQEALNRRAAEKEAFPSGSGHPATATAGAAAADAGAALASYCGVPSAMSSNQATDS